MNLALEDWTPSQADVLLTFYKVPLTTVEGVEQKIDGQVLYQSGSTSNLSKYSYPFHPSKKCRAAIAFRAPGKFKAWEAGGNNQIRK